MKNTEQGIYTIDLPLAMPGEWYVQITLKKDGSERLIEGNKLIAKGEKHMKYMKGFHRDQPDAHKN